MIKLRTTTMLGLATVLVAAMAILGSTAFAKGKPSATQAETTTTVQSEVTVTAPQSPGKALVCHRTHSKKKPFHTINVSLSAVPAHLAHGDTLGECVVAPLSVTTTEGTATTTAHGNSANAKGHNK
jgi:hypothetical protein